MAEPHSPPASPRPNADAVYERFPYNEEFQNALADAISDPDSQIDDAINVLPNNSSSKSLNQPNCIRLSEIDPSSLPDISAEELPLPLHDPRRKFASPWPGVKLTHPCGAIEGGPGPMPILRADLGGGQTYIADSRELAFARDFITKNGIRSQAQLRKNVDRAVRERAEQLKKTMQARKDALDDNARIDAEIKQLEDQRAMERKVEARLRQQKNKPEDD